MIYLVRHALADYASHTPYNTLPGPSLTATGIEQAAASAKLLEHSGIERVVSSPMRRCVMTAEVLCTASGLDLRIDDDLGEVQHGETSAEVALRMLRAMLAQVNLASVALVSHSAPMEELMLALTHRQLALPQPDHRGARIGVAQIWQLMHHSGRWHAQYLPPGGVPA